MGPTVVELNVGGQRFATLRSTLESGSDGESYLTTILGRGGSPGLLVDHDRDGVVFIDRDPTLFAAILRYLRTDQWTCPEGYNAQQVLKEAQFYGLRLRLCDFTVAFLKAEARSKKRSAEMQTNLDAAGSQIMTHMHSLLEQGRDLVFAVLPTLGALRREIGTILLKTGRDTTESIDIDKLHIADTTQENLPYHVSDPLHAALSSFPPEVFAAYVREEMKFGLSIERGRICFPYSTTVVSADECTVITCETLHAPVFSKLHGTLQIFRDQPNDHDTPGGTPNTTVSIDHEDLVLHQRYFPVGDAWYIFWDPEQSNAAVAADD
ncbi:hypothetical protein DIPPA_13968 [Diplonema papillatum]|nr:hypothetical protein DIPPA_13968 [Diplonema papillatum]